MCAARAGQPRREWPYHSALRNAAAFAFDHMLNAPPPSPCPTWTFHALLRYNAGTGSERSLPNRGPLAGGLQIAGPKKEPYFFGLHLSRLDDLHEASRGLQQAAKQPCSLAGADLRPSHPALRCLLSDVQRQHLGRRHHRPCRDK